MTDYNLQSAYIRVSVSPNQLSSLSTFDLNIMFIFLISIRISDVILYIRLCLQNVVQKMDAEFQRLFVHHDLLKSLIDLCYKGKWSNMGFGLNFLDPKIDRPQKWICC